MCAPSSIQSFYSYSKLKDHFKEINNNELFIVGLDFHTGFLFKRKNILYFAHSNYINQLGVEIEIADQSEALLSSNAYFIGNLTGNDNLVSDWLK